MQSYRCQCGQMTSVGSDPPKACQGCSECNTTLEQHPDHHKTPVPHKPHLEIRLTSTTDHVMVFSTCLVCSEILDPAPNAVRDLLEDRFQRIWPKVSINNAEPVKLRCICGGTLSAILGCSGTCDRDE